jgi:ubiquinone biosynthesis protein
MIKLFRILHIQMIFARYGLDNILSDVPALSFLRFIAYLNPFNWFRRERHPRGEAVRLALQELGPIFVKFGQALSTRRDLFPDDIADELAKLQDKVPAFSSKKAIEIIEASLGKPVDELFAQFDRQPLASASIAQVHVATLHNGDEVVVKVLRPSVRKAIKRDVALLYSVARLIEKYGRDTKRLRPVDVIAEFDKTIHDELDFMREAANASQLRRNFENSHLLYVPQIYWPYCRERVMVLERIHGIPVTNMAELRRHNINLKKLAERGVEIFFTQVFRDSFFHADMHPGNIFVDPSNPEDPKYICVDFGIIGTLNSQDKNYLAQNFHAFFHRDYNRVATLHIDSGWVPADTRVDEFEAAIRTVSEPIFERPLRDISIAQMLMRLFQTGQRFKMEVQPQLILLQKTLFAIEGLGRQLYPELDLWTTAKPYLENWLKEQAGFKELCRTVAQEAPDWSRQLPLLPNLVYDLFQDLRQEQLQLKSQLKLRREQRPERRRIRFFKGAGLAFLVAGLGFLLVHYAPHDELWAWSLVAFGGVLTLANR